MHNMYVSKYNPISNSILILRIKCNISYLILKTVDVEYINAGLSCLHTDIEIVNICRINKLTLLRLAIVLLSPDLCWYQSNCSLECPFY